ncbi:hypothetical protein IDH16_00470 [Pelagibacterales bacterium SAG-MED45]|nr:hypothetical protein [Pelagibacterales bacterium SAG-MED45]
MKISETLSLSIILIFSFLISFYFGHQGLMPLDDLQNFNSGYRTLKGDFPFRDYYSITGPILDIWQGKIYKIFGISWQSFLLHASLMNCLYSLSIFIFLKKLKFNKINCFFYSLSAGLLMYPPSGNPTVEHNSLILSSIATLIFFIALIENKKNYLFFSILIFFIAFFTKQVPTSYFIIFCFLIYIFKIFSNYNIETSIHIFIYTIIVSFIFIIYFKLNNVSFEDIFNQYILIAMNLGENRFIDINFNFVYEKVSKLFFLLFLLIPSFYLSYVTKKLDISLILVGLSLVITLYEVHSNNQPITFSLLPLYISLFYHFYSKENLKLNFIKYFLYLIIFYTFFRILRYELFYIFILVFIFFIFYFKYKPTINNLLLIYLFITSCFYFEKYIKIRAWDDLNKNDLITSFDAAIIDSKFKYLKWKTIYYENIDEEKKLIFSTLDYLRSLDQDINYILITDYQIYNIILNKKDFSPVKYWFKDATYPSKIHNLRINFENFFKSKITKNNVTQIIIDNTSKFKSEELSEFNWLYNCLEKKNNFSQQKYLDIFLIKNNCIK